MDDKYYLQDSSTYVGNDMLFWKKDGKGYTTDTREAHVFTKEDAVKQHHCRETDIPWPKVYIDERVKFAVDSQCVSRCDALRGTGISLIGQRRKDDWKDDRRFNRHRDNG